MPPGETALAGCLFHAINADVNNDSALAHVIGFLQILRGPIGPQEYLPRA